MRVNYHHLDHKLWCCGACWSFVWIRQCNIFYQQQVKCSFILFIWACLFIWNLTTLAVKCFFPQISCICCEIHICQDSVSFLFCIWVSCSCFHAMSIIFVKVSKFQKQIFLFSFEPKAEWNYFLISALASKKSSNKKLYYIIMLNSPKLVI